MAIQEYVSEFTRLRAKAASRDARWGRITEVRRPGGLKTLYPDAFPEDSPYGDDPKVANMIDIAATDLAQVMAPLPSFNCASSLSSTDRAKKFAGKRSLIVAGYVQAADLQIQMFASADHFNSFGAALGVVRADFERKTPVIQLLSPLGCYWVRNQWGRIVRYFQTVSLDVDEAAAMYPHLKGWFGQVRYGGSKIEFVRYQDDRSEGMFATTRAESISLEHTVNVTGRCLARMFKRPNLGDEEIGQFDDAIAVQLAKAVFAELSLEGAAKAVQAPIAMPTDVQELSFGPDAILRSANPQAIRRLDINLPSTAFAQQAQLDQELRQGSRYPDIRTGNTDASIVTGRGAQALMGGFDTQVKTFQTVYAAGLAELVGMCFEMDEKLWPDTTKTLRGNDSGTPYEIEYTPSKDIKGDRSVEVQYGLMAGLNPNQALVFALQALGAQLVSRDYVRRQLPFSLDAIQEEQAVDTETLRDALKAALAGYAGALPALAAQGGDPSDVLLRMSKVITDRQKGVAIEVSIAEAFAPPPQPEQPAMEEGAPGGMPAQQGAMVDQSGGMPPDVMSLLANVGVSGKANLSAGVQRRLPV